MAKWTTNIYELWSERVYVFFLILFTWPDPIELNNGHNLIHWLWPFFVTLILSLLKLEAVKQN